MGLSNAERQARWRAKRATEIERLCKAPAKAAPLSDSQKLVEARKEIETLRQRIHDLEAARVRRERAGKSAPPPTGPDGEDDPRIARLQKSNSELRVKLRDPGAETGSVRAAQSMETGCTTTSAARVAYLQGRVQPRGLDDRNLQTGAAETDEHVVAR
jgi:hypothetical protein